MSRKISGRYLNVGVSFPERLRHKIATTKTKDGARLTYRIINADTGVGLMTLARLVNGQNIPSKDTIYRLCKAYGWGLTDLVGTYGEPRLAEHLESSAKGVPSGK